MIGAPLGAAPRKALRVLHVEDSENDSALVMRELRRGGFDPSFERVQTRVAFKDALRKKDWDIIISDYALPGYDGAAALADAQETGRDIPFILVSGTIGEETAVDAMRAGAHDYVLKNKLTRLAPAVARELHESKERGARRVAEDALRESEGRLRRLAESGLVGIIVGENSGKIVAANDAFLAMVGYSRADLEAGLVSWARMTPPEWSSPRTR